MSDSNKRYSSTSASRTGDSSAYNSALESLNSSSSFETSPGNKSGKSPGQASIDLLSSERQPPKKELFQPIDQLDESISDLSYVDVSSTPNASFISNADTTLDKSRTHTTDEIIIVSSEDESTFGRTDDESDTNTTYDRANTILSNNAADQSTVDEITATSTAEVGDAIRVYDSIEEFERNLPPTVTVLSNEYGSKVYVVGTAHFSKESQDDVSLVIRNVRPDIVMVELCAQRVHMLQHDEKTLLEEARDINFAKIRSITKTNGLVNGLFYILMLNMSAKLTQDLGMAPGGEFRRALEEIHRLPNPVLHLGDRSINITLQRAFNGLSLWQTVKIVCKLLFSNKTITKEEVEQCKQKDLLEELMEQMAGEYPVFRDVFVTERDLYLCHSLTVAAAPQELGPNGLPKPVTVVGIVGIGHSSGISKNWGKVDPSQLPNILTIPPASLSNRIFKTTVKYSTMTLIGYGIYRIFRPIVPRLF